MHENISHVSPLNQSLSGAVRKQVRRRSKRRPVHPVTNVELAPGIRAELVKLGVDMLCVEVIDAQNVVVHNSRDW